jgi:hypothetical protein
MKHCRDDQILLVGEVAKQQRKETVRLARVSVPGVPQRVLASLERRKKLVRSSR